MEKNETYDVAVTVSAVVTGPFTAEVPLSFFARPLTAVNRITGMTEQQPEGYLILVTAQSKDEYCADGPGPGQSPHTVNHWTAGHLPQDSAQVAASIHDTLADATRDDISLPWRVVTTAGLPPATASPDLQDKVLAAIRDFSFGNYGCDEMEDLVSDPSLDVGPALAAHIAQALAR